MHVSTGYTNWNCCRNIFKYNCGCKSCFDWFIQPIAAANILNLSNNQKISMAFTIVVVMATMDIMLFVNDQELSSSLISPSNIDSAKEE